MPDASTAATIGGYQGNKSFVEEAYRRNGLVMVNGKLVELRLVHWCLECEFGPGEDGPELHVQKGKEAVFHFF